MNAREFLDTNVLIYAHDARDPRPLLSLSGTSTFFTAVP